MPAASRSISCAIRHLTGVQDLRRITITTGATGVMIAGIIANGTEAIAMTDVTGTGMTVTTEGAATVMVMGVGMDAMTTELGVNH
ncbi:hypothetical protein GL58_15275 [Comamonas testosteroni]|uniref:Uncharacterized protein n=1 Tax=Comamonas testosteroni TaxID=285 RepID=A0A0L7MDI4_COMTE|nr:hypothetical protein GL58_15275 [Comamonas testosteroni]